MIAILIVAYDTSGARAGFRDGDEPLRVLCLTSWFPPHHFGGYELSCQDVMTRLVDRGHHVEVLTSDHRHAGPELADDPSVVVHRRLRLYFRDGRPWSPSVPRRLAIERSNRDVLRAAIQDARPDVVAVWHMGAMSLGLVTELMRSEMPTVFAISDDWPTYVLELDPWMRAMSGRRIIGRAVTSLTGLPTAIPDLDAAGAHCFISERTRQRCRDASAWSFPMSTIVYSCIDTDLFEADEGRGRRRAPEGSTRLLYVGRIDERKGIKTLVRSLASVDDATLTIDGHAAGAEVDEVRSWADEAGVGDRVEIQRSDRHDLPDVYRNADICVFPSEWEEPFGLVPLEAMACGTPVIATGIGGSGEFLMDGRNCVLYPAGDSGALASAIRNLRDDERLRDELVFNGFKTARFFGADPLTDSFERWYAAAAADQLAAARIQPRRPLTLP